MEATGLSSPIKNQLNNKPMKIIKTSILGKRTKSVAVFPFILVNKDFDISEIDINHEKIHFQQQKELLIIPFYLWYWIEFLIKWVKYRFNFDIAYLSISFEKEAYTNEADLGYLKGRNPLKFLKYL